MRGWSHEHFQTKCPEVRQGVVRIVFYLEADYPSQWAAIGAIAPKVACTPETLRSWVHQAEHDAGRREGIMTRVAYPVD